jgi:hypothetical protein
MTTAIDLIIDVFSQEKQRSGSTGYRSCLSTGVLNIRLNKFASMKFLQLWKKNSDAQRPAHSGVLRVSADWDLRLEKFCPKIKIFEGFRGKLSEIRRILRCSRRQKMRCRVVLTLPAFTKK